jgi:hypothetical protein
MKVRTLVDYLVNNYDLDDSIVVAWWEKEQFNAVPPDEWEEATEYMEEIDWSHTYDALSNALNDYLN